MKQASHVKKTLIELCDWIVTDNEIETKCNQKLLRNLKVKQIICKFETYALLGFRAAA